MTPRVLAIAREWATELGRFTSNWGIVAEEAVWGFRQVDLGRQPDAVLKEVLKRCIDRGAQRRA